MMEDQHWEVAETLAIEATLEPPRSLDFLYLRAVAGLHAKIRASLPQDLSGENHSTLCRSVISSPGPIPVYSSPVLARPIGTVTFTGTWGNAPGSGDATYNLDTVNILRQEPPALRVQTTNGDSLWIDDQSVYVARFTVENDSSGQVLQSVPCFPRLPLTFDLQNELLYVTFYPSRQQVLSRMADAIGIHDLGFLTWREAELLAAEVRAVPWGVGAVLDFRSLQLYAGEARHPRPPDHPFRRDRSDYGLPDNAVCGQYPHGPGYLQLCYHEFLSFSSDRKLRAYTTRPHDNLY